MLYQVKHLGEAPRLFDVLRREEAAHALVEYGEPDVHEHEAKKEVGHCQPGEAEKCEGVVAERVLTDPRVDADGDGKCPRDDYREPGKNDRQPEAVADQLLDGLFVCAVADSAEKGPAQIPLPSSTAMSDSGRT